MNTPETGMADRNRGGDTSSTASSENQSVSTSGSTYGTADRSSQSGDRWESGVRGTGGWDTACFINPSTTSFVLLTNDGRQVRLDDASNTMIQQRLQSTNRVSQKSKIFRVHVSGDITGGTIHVNDIQM